MLGPRLGALGALKSVRLVSAPRGLTPRLTRAYATGNDGATDSQRRSGDRASGSNDLKSRVWDANAVSQFSNALSGTQAASSSADSIVSQGTASSEASDYRPKRAWQEKRYPPRNDERRAPPFRKPRPENRRDSGYSRDSRDAKTRDFGGRSKRPPFGFRRRETEGGDAEPKPMGGELASGSAWARKKRVRTVAAQRDNFLRVHGKTIAYLEKSDQVADQELAKQHRKALSSMEEQLNKLMESLKAELPKDEFERFENSLTRDKSQRPERVATRVAEGRPELAYRQRVTLGRSAGLRVVDSEALRVESARKWALMARQQAERAATMAELDGATEDAKTASEVLSRTAELANQEFQRIREEYKDRLSPAELRDIEISQDEGNSSSFTGAEVDEAFANSGRQTFKRDGRFVSEVFGELAASDFPVKPVQPPRNGKVARLSNQLQRVLFSPGVHYIRDPRTGVWNFPPELTKIPTPDEFNFDTLPDYVTASKDPELRELGQGEGIKYVGSTSTVTQSLSQIWFALNGGHGVDIDKLTQPYAIHGNAYTAGAQLPASTVLWPQSNGRYAVDADKRFDTDNNILSQYGNILEKILTTDPSEWWRSLKGAPADAVPQKKPTAREAYAYSRGGSVLMRSQIDCQDNRLPGSGTFDIKTRACLPIRHDRANWVAHSVFDISETLGDFATFERETFDLTRSGMLKYCFQARIGDMDGIFIAYHNTARCFGFEYMPRTELDERLFGSADVGDQVFALCVGFFERIMDLATDMFPSQAISVTLFQAQPPQSAYQRAKSGDSRDANELIVAVQPMEWEGEGEIPTRAIKIQMINNVDGKDVPANQGIKFFAKTAADRMKQKWTVRYNIAVTPDTEAGHVAAREVRANAVQRLIAMTSLALPEGKTVADMHREAGGADTTADPTDEAVTEPAPTSGSDTLSFAKTNWVEPTAKIRELRQSAKFTAAAYERRAAGWNDVVQELKATDPEPETKPEPYVIEDHEFQPTVRREHAAPVEEPVWREEGAVESEDFVEKFMADSGEDGVEDSTFDFEASEARVEAKVPSMDAGRRGRDLPPHIARVAPRE